MRIYVIMQIEYLFHPSLQANSYDYFHIGQFAIIKII